jgi:flagellar hook-length control protein FliK
VDQMDLAQILNLAGNGKTKAPATTAEPQAVGAGFLMAFSAFKQDTAAPVSVWPNAKMLAKTSPDQPDAGDEGVDVATAKDGAEASLDWTAALFLPPPATQQVPSAILPPASPLAEPEFGIAPDATPDLAQSAEFAKVDGQNARAITREAPSTPASLPNIKLPLAESPAPVLPDAETNERGVLSAQNRAEVAPTAPNPAAVAKEQTLPIPAAPEAPALSPEVAQKPTRPGQTPNGPHSELSMAAGDHPKPNPTAQLSTLPPVQDSSAQLRPTGPNSDRAAADAPQNHSALHAQTPRPEASGHSHHATNEAMVNGRPEAEVTSPNEPHAEDAPSPADAKARPDASVQANPPTKDVALPLVAPTGFDAGVSAQPDTAAQIEPKSMPLHTDHTAIASTPKPLPQGLVSQMAETITRFPDRPVDISLSPEELGRVRMTLTTTDNTLTLSLVVDRAETLDLMRRNIHQLAQDFRDLGYENLNFSFAQGEDPRHAGTTRADSGDDDLPKKPEPDPIRPVTTAPRTQLPAGGIDIRI